MFTGWRRALEWRRRTGGGQVGGRPPHADGVSYRALDGIGQSEVGKAAPKASGPDGSTQPAQETGAGLAGSGKHVPTSLRGIANRAPSGNAQSKHHRFRNRFGEVTVELLMDCWHDLNKDAASGVDGLTAVHNFHIHRPDGSTAAKRCFGRARPPRFAPPIARLPLPPRVRADDDRSSPRSPTPSRWPHKRDGRSYDQGPE